MKDIFGHPGLGGYYDVFVVLDRWSDMMSVHPVKTLEVGETYKALKYFIGEDSVKLIDRIYSDNHKSLIGACEMLGINHELKQMLSLKTETDLSKTVQDLAWFRQDYLHVSGHGP